MHDELIASFRKACKRSDDRAAFRKNISRRIAYVNGPASSLKSKIAVLVAPLVRRADAIRPYKKNPWKEAAYCEGCGSDEIQTLAWIRPTTGEIISTAEGGPSHSSDNWCPACDSHQRISFEDTETV